MRHWVGKFLGLDVFVDYHDNKINFYIEGMTYLDKGEVKKLFEEYVKSVIRVDISKIEDVTMYSNYEKRPKLITVDSMWRKK